MADFAETGTHQGVRRQAHVDDVGPVHGEGRFDAALAVDGKLLGEVGGPIGVGHGAGGQQQ